MIKHMLLALCLSLSLSACKPEAAFSQTDASPSVAPASVAPEFQGIDNWINSAPLTMAELRGKVVLVEFWTYSCINCIHVLPYTKEWDARYRDQGLVVVGVHTPEYGYERVLSNVKEAVTRFGIQYAVAQDNGYATWQAYDNSYWPALYLIDREGRIVYQHFGEGDYAETEAKIQELLGKK